MNLATWGKATQGHKKNKEQQSEQRCEQTGAAHYGYTVIETKDVSTKVKMSLK